MSDASRQAYFYRTKEEAVHYFQQILAAVMDYKHLLCDQSVAILKNTFKRILVQDSTIIRLPQKLYEIFSGVKNAITTVCNARIQTIYDLLSGSFISFSIDTYSDNDLKVARKLEVQEGDWVLRDRGYYLLAAIQGMKQHGADSILRYKHKTAFYDSETKKEIDLLQLLQTRGHLDIRVVAGENKEIPLRIIAAAAGEEVANLRRMKAKKEAKSRGCSYELLQLLGWTIFITTIDDEEFTFQHAAILYSLRWRIECIFKTWKSNFSFDKIHTVSEMQLRVLLLSRFIMITLLYERAYKPLELYIADKAEKQLSLMKFMRFVSKNLKIFCEQWCNKNNSNAVIQLVQRYCCFEKRKRINFNIVFDSICS